MISLTRPAHFSFASSSSSPIHLHKKSSAPIERIYSITLNENNLSCEFKLYPLISQIINRIFFLVALLTFSDGNYVGAVLDRNGLRPSRYYVTKDGLMIMASEVGVSSVVPENITYKVMSILFLLTLI